MIVVRSGEGKDLMMERGAQCNGGIVLIGDGLVVEGMVKGRKIAQAILNPAIENSGVPCLVEWATLESFLCGLSRRPQISPVSGELGGLCDDSLVLLQAESIKLSGLPLDNRVE
jgi:hypothetical protein